VRIGEFGGKRKLSVMEGDISFRERNMMGTYFSLKVQKAEGRLSKRKKQERGFTCPGKL